MEQVVRMVGSFDRRFPTARPVNALNECGQIHLHRRLFCLPIPKAVIKKLLKILTFTRTCLSLMSHVLRGLLTFSKPFLVSKASIINRDILHCTVKSFLFCAVIVRAVYLLRDTAVRPTSQNPYVDIVRSLTNKRTFAPILATN